MTEEMLAKKFLKLKGGKNKKIFTAEQVKEFYEGKKGVLYGK